MWKKILIAFTFLILIFIVYLYFYENVFLISNANFFNLSSDINILILGKPGPGYIGSENTDSIIVFHYDKNSNQVFLIPIPRDLIVKDDQGNLEKINALYEKNKIDLLLKKASQYSGFSIKNYIAVDLNLVIKLVDFLGGVDIYLPEPVTDPITLYTIPAGEHNLNGYLIELVLRSRYHPQGDFFRMKNQIIFLKALKEKILSLDTKGKLELMKFLENNKYYWQTNLSKNELLVLGTTIKDLKSLKITPIIIDLKNGLLTSGYFQIYNSENVYGIYPTAGIDNFNYIRAFIRSQIKENL